MREIICDGCGQPASSEHTARRLQRLEWATRYRPIHLHTLLLGAISPADDANFLYWPGEDRAEKLPTFWPPRGSKPGTNLLKQYTQNFNAAGFSLPIFWNAHWKGRTETTATTLASRNRLCCSRAYPRYSLAFAAP